MNRDPWNEAATKLSWQRLAVMLLGVASAGYVCRVAVTVAGPGMMSEFGLSQARMGTIFTAFLVGYTAFQIPSGWLADRADARKVFLWLCAGWCALTLLTAGVGWRGIGFSAAIPLLWLSRGLFGVVAAPTYPASGRILAVTVAPRHRAQANGLVLASVGVGSALAPVLLAPVADRYGWRACLLVAAVLSAAVGALWWNLSPQFRGTESVDAVATEGTQTAAVSHLVVNPFRNRSFWFLSASYFLQSYLGYIFVFWFFLYLVQVRHFAFPAAGWLTSLPWMATIVAIPAGGMLSDFAVRIFGPTWGRRSVPIAVLLAAAAFLAVGARTASASVAVAALTGCTVLVMCTEGPFWATMTQLSREKSGVAGGTMNFAGNLGGIISPTLTPWLAERMGWERALALTAGLAVLASLLWLGVKLERE